MWSVSRSSHRPSSKAGRPGTTASTQRPVPKAGNGGCGPSMPVSACRFALHSPSGCSSFLIGIQPIPIDIEKQRSKILKIARKFTPIEEYRTLANEDALIRKLTMVWGAKESLYKSFAEAGVSFLKNIYVEDFDMEELETSAQVSFNGKSEHYNVWFQEFEGFTCAYALISDNHA